MKTAFYARRLPPARRSALLREVLAKSGQRTAAGAPVLVFDLDGTLMDNRPRVVAILRELEQAWKAEHPDASERVGRATAERIVYGFVENLTLLGVHDPRLHESGFAFWKARFFADLHIRHDVATPGASAYVRACYEAGATIVYLTGRDLPNMALGSFASLRDLGFPIGVVGTELVVKPSFEMPDADFKRDVAPSLSRLGHVVAAFDNETVNVNLFASAHPECTSVLLDTQHSPSPPPLDPRVQIIGSFDLDP